MRLERARDMRSQARERLQSNEDITRLPEGAISLGVAYTDKPENYALAVRIREKSGIVRLEALIREILSPLADNELDVRYTGPLFALQPALGRASAVASTPVRIGDSVSHDQSLGGTLGFFATDNQNGDRGIVSANHVIAEVDQAKAGDSIVRPATGTTGSTKIAELVRCVPLSGEGLKEVDAAFAKLTTTNFDSKSLPGGQTLQQVAGNIHESTSVQKFGDRSRRTFGRVTSFDYDTLQVVGYSANLLIVNFENQLEIESTDPNHDFALDGDSGSLLYNDRQHAVGLLFSRCVAGGTLKNGLAYASPIRTVLKLLDVSLLV